MAKLKLTEEKRKELAARLVRMVDSATSSVKPLRERWTTNEKLYRLEPYERSTAAFDDASSFAFPLMREKVDSMVANLATLIAQADPTFIYKLSSSESWRSDIVEKTVQFILRNADFERALRLHLQLTSLNGKAAYWVKFKVRAKGMLADVEDSAGFTMPDTTSKDVAYCGVDLQVLHLGDLVVYPAEAQDLQEARIVGHRFAMRKGDIKAKQASGEYLENVTEFASVDRKSIVSGRDPNWDLISSDTAVEDDDEYVDCYNLVFKEDFNGDGLEEYALVTLAYDQQALLSIEPYDFDRPWYFCPSLHVEYGQFYPSNSVAQNLQGLNLAQNELVGMFYDGTMARAFPTAVFNAEGGYTEDAFLDAAPGRLYPVNGTPQIGIVQGQFDPSTIPTLLQYLDTYAEQITRTPRASATQPYRRNTTATEVSAIQQAASISGNDYLMCYTSGEFCAIADFVRELAYQNFDLLKAVYGDMFPATEQEELAPGGVWDVAARAPSRTPMGRLQVQQMLLALAIQTQSPNINVPELIKSIVMDSGLPNADQIYVSEDEIAANQEQLLGNQVNPLLSGMAGIPGLSPIQGGGGYQEPLGEESLDGGGPNLALAGGTPFASPVG